MKMSKKSDLVDKMRKMYFKKLICNKRFLSSNSSSNAVFAQTYGHYKPTINH